MREPYKRSRFVADKMNLRKVDGRLNVMCWCQREVVLVLVADVRDGRTETCGHRECRRA